MAYNVLIVDDSQTMRKVIRKSLVLSGFKMGECWEAGDGRQALDLFHSQRVDLILTDLNLPGMSGLDMVKELQQEENFRRVPVIIITTHNNENLLQEGSALGIKAYIQKPFRPETIRDVLSQTMEKSHV